MAIPLAAFLLFLEFFFESLSYSNFRKSNALRLILYMMLINYEDFLLELESIQTKLSELNKEVQINKYDLKTFMIQKEGLLDELYRCEIMYKSALLDIRKIQNQLNALETLGFVKQQEYLKSQMRSYRKGFSEERNLLVQLGS